MYVYHGDMLTFGIQTDSDPVPIINNSKLKLLLGACNALESCQSPTVNLQKTVNLPLTHFLFWCLHVNALNYPLQHATHAITIQSHVHDVFRLMLQA